MYLFLCLHFDIISDRLFSKLLPCIANFSLRHSIHRFDVSGILLYNIPFNIKGRIHFGYSIMNISLANERNYKLQLVDKIENVENEMESCILQHT